MNKLVVKSLSVLLLTSALSGCIGQMATSGMVMKANLTMVDNRYARAGLYMLMSPVYGIAASADLFIFNSIEFWTGRNPISGKGKAVADMPANAIIRFNDKIDKQLTSAPIDISAVNVNQVDDKTLEMLITHLDGSSSILRGKKAGENVDFFLNNELIATASIDELEDYIERRI